MAVNLAPVVIAIISALGLALLALAVVMYIYCKSQHSLLKIRETRRRRRRAAAVGSKRPTTNDVYPSSAVAARLPTWPQQQQQLLRPLRSQPVDFNYGAQPLAQSQQPYFLAPIRNDRFAATRPLYGAPPRPATYLPRPMYLSDASPPQRSDYDRNTGLAPWAEGRSGNAVEAMENLNYPRGVAMAYVPRLLRPGLGPDPERGWTRTGVLRP